MALSTKNATNNTFTVKKMLQQDDIGEFIETMLKEIDYYEYLNQ